MSKSLEVVKEVYNRFSESDFDGFLRLCSEDIEWVVNGPVSLEKCKSFHGHNGVRQFLDILGGQWEFSSFNTKQFIVEGDTVVVLGEETGSEKASGTGFENRWAHVFDVKEGKVVRFREFLCHWPGDEKPPVMSWGTM